MGLPAIPVNLRRIRDLRPTARTLLRAVPALLLAAAAAVTPRPAAAQSYFSNRPVDFGMTYLQERSKFVGSNSSNYFYLRGAKLDYTMDLFHGLGPSVTADGLAVTNLRGSIDIQHIQFLVGPRYTYNLGHNSDTLWGRRGGAFVEAKIGYTIAPSGIYPNGNGSTVTSTSALTYSGGAGINLTLYHRFDLRLIEGGLVRTDLPNGGSNVQNTVYVGSGINVHFGQ